MERLRPLQKIHPSLYLNVISTVTPTNAHCAPQFIDEIVRDISPNTILINFFRHHSLDGPPIDDNVIEAYRETIETYERHLEAGRLKHYKFFASKVLRVKGIFQKELIYRVAKNREFVTPCTVGTFSYVIMEDGSIKPCEILDDVAGSVQKIVNGQSFGEMASSVEAKAIRQ
jgi:hypothetical protein